MNHETLNLVEFAIKRAFEAHPRPTAVTQVQAAEMLSVSTATVSRMVRSGILRRNSCGLIPISEVDRVLAAA